MNKEELIEIIKAHKNADYGLDKIDKTKILEMYQEFLGLKSKISMEESKIAPEPKKLSLQDIIDAEVNKLKS